MIRFSSEDIIIRDADKSDIEIIISLIFSLAQYEKLENEFQADPDLIAKALFGEKQYAECLIAEYQKTPVGFAIFFHNFSTFKGKPRLYLEDLFVNPDFRRKGIGKRLLVELAKIASDRNCCRFEWCVLNWNQPAIDFYKSLGAAPMDDWTIYRIEGDNIKALARAL